jgi:hypothetical protein
MGVCQILCEQASGDIINEWWCDHQRAPQQGDIIETYWIEEPRNRKEEATGQQKSGTDIQVDQRVQEDSEHDDEYDEAMIPTPIEQTGGPEAPLEKIQLEAQRLLPSKGEEKTNREHVKVELGVPPIEISKPVPLEALNMSRYPMLIPEFVKWKSDFQPDKWKAEMDQKLSHSISSEHPSWKRLKEWITLENQG